VARQAADFVGLQVNDPEALVAPGLSPGRLPVRASKEVRHRLAVVADRLLLHDHAALGEPRIGYSRCGQLPTPFRETRRRTATDAPPGLLFHAQIPHEPSIRAVSQQHHLLCLSWLEPISGHANIISNQGIIEL
jgi:hypothetical protein